ncbi:MAG TPA: diguanylate cyclase [Coleofasciculaceae cyanobacterium]
MDDDTRKLIESRAWVREMDFNQPLPETAESLAVEALPGRLAHSPIDPEALPSPYPVERDAAAMMEAINRYLKDAPPLLQAICLATNIGDFEGLTYAARTLKSRSAALGVTILYQLCQDLEKMSKGGTTMSAPNLVSRLKAEYEKVEATLHAQRQRAISRMNPVSPPEAPSIILVVDDDPSMRQILRRVMEKDGYQVVEAANGEQGLEAYKRLKPHLVLLDALMPVMDGFACCTQLQTLINESPQDGEALSHVDGLNGTSRTPVLMITGLDDQESVDRAFAVGATDYVTKPIHFAVLRQRVRRLIQQAQLYQKLEVANRELQRLAALDGLTGVANRRRFDQYIEEEWQCMAKEELPLSLILCDIDFFKKYNDTYGHQAGDACLRQVADALRFCTRRSADLVARYGGEEFAIVLPNTTLASAAQIAEAMRIAVSALEIVHVQSAVSKYVTLSLGIACLTPTLSTSPTLLIAAADAALYQAKAAGRNRYFTKVCQP